MPGRDVDPPSRRQLRAGVQLGKHDRIVADRRADDAIALGDEQLDQLIQPGAVQDCVTNRLGAHFGAGHPDLLPRVASSFRAGSACAQGRTSWMRRCGWAASIPEISP